MQCNTQVLVGKHNNRQHASPHHEVATDVKQMPIWPIIIIICHARNVTISVLLWQIVCLYSFDSYLGVNFHLCEVSRAGISDYIPQYIYPCPWYLAKMKVKPNLSLPWVHKQVTTPVHTLVLFLGFIFIIVKTNYNTICTMSLHQYFWPKYGEIVQNRVMKQ